MLFPVKKLFSYSQLVEREQRLPTIKYKRIRARTEDSQGVGDGTYTTCSLNSKEAVHTHSQLLESHRCQLFSEKP